MRNLLNRMLNGGEICRERETFRNKPRYRYFRKPVSPEIAELDRLLEG
jgi:hypothetical protein